jgi:hypothetical protein
MMGEAGLEMFSGLQTDENAEVTVKFNCESLNPGFLKRSVNLRSPLTLEIKHIVVCWDRSVLGSAVEAGGCQYESWVRLLEEQGGGGLYERELGVS